VFQLVDGEAEAPPAADVPSGTGQEMSFLVAQPRQPTAGT
jgi:hypothetical protein